MFVVMKGLHCRSHLRWPGGRRRVWHISLGRKQRLVVCATNVLETKPKELNSPSYSLSQLYLDVLPTQKTQWAEAAGKSRRAYADAVKKFILDPTTISADDDLAKNNPLAVDDDAPWQQHFQDEEYRKDIQQDINRTFPEVRLSAFLAHLNFIPRENVWRIPRETRRKAVLFSGNAWTAE